MDDEGSIPFEVDTTDFSCCRLADDHRLDVCSSSFQTSIVAAAIALYEPDPLPRSLEITEGIGGNEGNGTRKNHDFDSPTLSYDAVGLTGSCDC